LKSTGSLENILKTCNSVNWKNWKKWKNLTYQNWTKKIQISSSVTRNEIETVIKKKNLSKKKSPGPEGFTIKFYQTIEELTPMLFKLSHKLQREQCFNSSH
jgi:hypothetical protein